MAKAKNAYTKIYEKNRNTLNKSAKGEKKSADNAYSLATANIGKNFANSERQATTLYRQGQQALKSDLPSVSGTTKNKLEVNYGGNLETNNVGKAAATASAKQVKDTTKSNATQNYYSKKADLKKDAGTNKIKRNDTINKNKLTTYKNTVSRYTTTAAIDKAIKNMKKSNDYYKSAKISYLKGQRSNLVAQQRAIAKASSSAGRTNGTSYSRATTGSQSSGSTSSRNTARKSNSNKTSSKAKTAYTKASLYSQSVNTAAALTGKKGIKTKGSTGLAKKDKKAKVVKNAKHFYNLRNTALGKSRLIKWLAGLK